MNQINLQTSVAGIGFNSCIYNASGPRDTTLAELQQLGESAAAAILMKSCTLLAREGNPEPRYADLNQGSLQSMGLPNLGYQKYLEMSTALKEYDKPVVASVAGLQMSDYETMVAAFQNSAVDLIEVNLSCPNIVGKPQLAYDLEATEAVLKAISRLGSKPMGLKLPTYTESYYFENIAKLVKRYGISFVTSINSLANCLVIDPDNETAIIKPKLGLGGLGGSYIKPLALANVRAFHELLAPEVAIIGVGGVMCGVNAFEFILAGASLVQVGTLLQQQGTECFARLEQELCAYLQSKNYSDLQQFRGKLKFL